MSEIYTVLGVAPYDFERDGRRMTGVSLHCSYPSDRVEGVAVERVSISSAILDGAVISVGDDLRFMYNKFGKISGFTIL